MQGGRPESLDAKDLVKLEKSPLYFLNIHYIGSNKEQLKYDICRILSLTGSKIINDPIVIEECQREMGLHPGLTCASRDNWYIKDNMCI